MTKTADLDLVHALPPSVTAARGRTAAPSCCCRTPESAMEELAAEMVVPGRAVTPLRIVARGVERPHGHPWDERVEACMACIREPEMDWVAG